MKTPLPGLRSVFSLALAASMTLLSGHATAQYSPYVGPPPYVVPAPVAYYPVAPAAPGWVTGAAVGSLAGAMASASNPLIRCAGLRCFGGFDPRAVLVGALLGGIIGHVATTPHVVAAGPAYIPPRFIPEFAGASGYPLAPAAAPPAGTSAGASAAAFTDRWQQFAAPSAGSSAAGASFAERWQSFAEPEAKPR